MPRSGPVRYLGVRSVRMRAKFSHGPARSSGFSSSTSRFADALAQQAEGRGQPALSAAHDHHVVDGLARRARVAARARAGAGSRAARDRARTRRVSSARPEAALLVVILGRFAARSKRSKRTSESARRCAAGRPWRSATSSATMLTAISSGLTAPMSSPTGANTRSSGKSPARLARTRSTKRNTLRLLPTRPTYCGIFPGRGRQRGLVELMIVSHDQHPVGGRRARLCAARQPDHRGPADNRESARRCSAPRVRRARALRSPRCARAWRSAWPRALRRAATAEAPAGLVPRKSPFCPRSTCPGRAPNRESRARAQPRRVRAAGARAPLARSHRRRPCRACCRPHAARAARPAVAGSTRRCARRWPELRADGSSAARAEPERHRARWIEWARMRRSVYISPATRAGNNSRAFAW